MTASMFVVSASTAGQDRVLQAICWLSCNHICHLKVLSCLKLTACGNWSQHPSSLSKPSPKLCFLATVEQIGALNVTHRAAHGSEVEHRFEGSTKLLAKLEQEYPRVFAEPEFSITEHRIPFSILLVDPTVQPTRCKLYPLSSLEL